MPRFALLYHDHPRIHWDLLLEEGNVLRAFRLDEPPEIGRTFQAERINDHRLIYLEYEGPISGGRGEVLQWDAGQFEWRHDSAERIAVDLVGRNFRGRLEMTSSLSDSSEPQHCLWTVHCHPADPAKPSVT